MLLALGPLLRGAAKVTQDQGLSSKDGTRSKENGPDVLLDWAISAAKLEGTLQMLILKRLTLEPLHGYGIGACNAVGFTVSPTLAN